MTEAEEIQRRVSASVRDMLDAYRIQTQGRLVVTVLCCLLAVVATAQPASQWMLWERHTYGSEGTTWRGLEAFGTERECRTAALREARLKYLSFGRTRSPQLKGSRVEVPVEFETQIFSYDCLPDTVDPRGPKGTK